MEPLGIRVRKFCAAHNLRLNTDLGQHFLIDQAILDTIVKAAAIDRAQHIVEIGPGIGILTKELLARASRVDAIEIDERMIPLLKEYTGNPPNLAVTQANALNATMPSEPYAVVANIPYHITSPLLRHLFLESPQKPTSATLLIQREVAEKICDEHDAGILTIIVRLFGTPKMICSVPKFAFLPPPKVESAVIRIDTLPEEITDRETMAKILSLAKTAFTGKRKMLRNTLGAFPHGMELLKRASIEETRRPQTLSIHEWVALAKEAVQDSR